MPTAVLDDPIALTDGAWVQRGGVYHWRSDAPTRKPVWDLIACPTCGAGLTDSCLSRTGLPTTEHATRLVARLCPCGEHRYSTPCPTRTNEEAA